MVAEAQLPPGLMYEKGQAVTKDEQEALKWYRLRAGLREGAVYCWHAQYRAGLERPSTLRTILATLVQTQGLLGCADELLGVT